MKATTLVIDVAQGDLGTPLVPEVDFLRSEAGSWYRVHDVHKVKSVDHPSRWRFIVERLGYTMPEGVREAMTFEGVEEPTVLHFHWNSR